MNENGAYTIMVVEDSPTQALKLQFLLEEQEYNTILAADGLLALESLKEQKPDLIISDVVMPRMDGYTLSQYIKSDSSISRIPIILLTTLSGSDNIVKSLEAQADLYIKKPYDDKLILSQIEHFLGRHESPEQGDDDDLSLILSGKRHKINATRKQMLHLLLSTHDNLLIQNKELEQRSIALKKAIKELEVSNKQLEYFAYIASHDLQEPLRKVKSFTELFATKYSDIVDEKGKRYIGYITDGAIRMKQLINDLLSFSRIRTQGKEFIQFDSGVPVGQIIELFDTKLKKVNGSISCTKLPLIKADESQFRLLMKNLIGNAIKFVEEDVPPEIQISAEESNTEWMFRIKDNGIGIEKQYKERIFIIFQRLHNREKYSGTGIGLALCSQIVERHKGKIGFESEIGKGSTFYFSLPKR